MKKVLLAPLFVAASLLSTTASAQMMDGMEGMDMGQQKNGAMPTTASYHAVGTVKKLDAAAGRVTIAHGPVPSLHWQAMTMTFTVQDRKLLDKLGDGKKVDFDFVQKDDDYIVTAVRQKTDKP